MIPHQHQTPSLLPTDSSKEDADQRLGRQVSFGIQQTLACWATDFIDPVVSRWFQNKYGDQHHHVTHTHTWGGEIAGDSAAFFVYIAAKRMFGGPIDGITSAVQSTFDTRLTKMGNKALKTWAQHEGVTPDSDVYVTKLEEYKRFQAENLVDTSIIAGAATGGNVLIQRALGNKQSYGMIFASKLIGAFLTMGAVLGMRTAVPFTMKSLDDELSERYFSKVVRFTKRALGVKDKVGITEPAALRTEVSGAEALAVLSEEKKRRYLRKLATYGELTPQVIASEKQWLNALHGAVAPDSAFAREFMRCHYEEVMRLQPMVADADALHAASEEAARAIMLGRQQDIQGYLAMLDIPNLAQQIKALPPTDADLQKQRHDRLVESLLQSKNFTRGESPVHILAHAKGQRLEHDILARCFAQDSAAAQAFTATLVKQLSAWPQQEVERRAADYMAARRKLAEEVREIFAIDGPLVNEALERAERLKARVGHGTETKTLAI